MRYIMGLDISTSCTGLCILHYDDITNHVVSCDTSFLQLDLFNKTYDKAKEVKNKLLSIKADANINITDIIIEENLQSFKTGLSSAHTLVTLARFNGIVSYISEEVFGISPRFINVNEARKSLGIKIIPVKKGGRPTKEQVFEWVSSDVKFKKLKIDWPMNIPTRGKNKGNLILSTYSYDMADAYVIALSSLSIPI